MQRPPARRLLAVLALALAGCRSAGHLDGPRSAAPVAIEGPDRVVLKPATPVLKSPLATPRPLYLSGYAGADYGPDRPLALPAAPAEPAPPRRAFGLFRARKTAEGTLP